MAAAEEERLWREQAARQVRRALGHEILPQGGGGGGGGGAGGQTQGQGVEDGAEEIPRFFWKGLRHFQQDASAAAGMTVEEPTPVSQQSSMQFANMRRNRMLEFVRQVARERVVEERMLGVMDPETYDELHVLLRREAVAEAEDRKQRLLTAVQQKQPQQQQPSSGGNENSAAAASLQDKENAGADGAGQLQQSGLADQDKSATATTAAGNADGEGNTEEGKDASAAEESPPALLVAEEDLTLSYKRFCAVRKQLASAFPEFANKYLAADSFLSLPRNGRGEIRLADLLCFIQRRIDVEKTLLQLHFYDRDGCGLITEQDLEVYVAETMQKVPVLRGVPDAFEPFFKVHAVRRFMFFLDPKLTGRISIKKLAHSLFMEEFLRLRYVEVPPISSPEYDGVVTFLENNWFTYQTAARVYRQFLELDRDGDGMLSPTELLNYPGTAKMSVHLTQTAVDRIFQEVVTYRNEEEDAQNRKDTTAAATDSGASGTSPTADGVADGGGNDSDSSKGNTSGNKGRQRPLREHNQLMDYKAFLDLVLAMEFPRELASLHYMWRLVDVQKTGRLSAFAIRVLFRDIQHGMPIRYPGFVDIPEIGDVTDEIFDMVRPAQAGYITLDDLVRCGVGHTVLSMLLDVDGFWRYDNRETLLQEEDEEGGDENGGGNGVGAAQSQALAGFGVGDGDADDSSGASGEVGKDGAGVGGSVEYEDDEDDELYGGGGDRLRKKAANSGLAGGLTSFGSGAGSSEVVSEGGIEGDADSPGANRFALDIDAVLQEHGSNGTDIPESGSDAPPHKGGPGRRFLHNPATVDIGGQLTPEGSSSLGGADRWTMDEAAGSESGGGGGEGASGVVGDTGSGSFEDDEDDDPYDF